jgi:hypothetical protein
LALEEAGAVGTAAAEEEVVATELFTASAFNNKKRGKKM